MYFTRVNKKYFNHLKFKILKYTYNNKIKNYQFVFNRFNINIHELYKFNCILYSMYFIIMMNI